MSLSPADQAAVDAYRGEITVCPPCTFSESEWELDSWSQIAKKSYRLAMQKRKAARQDRINRARGLAEKGYTSKQVAAELDVSHHTALQYSSAGRFKYRQSRPKRPSKRKTLAHYKLKLNEFECFCEKHGISFAEGVRRKGLCRSYRDNLLRRISERQNGRRAGV